MQEQLPRTCFVTCRPKTTCPAGNLSFQLCLRVGWISIHADQPQFAVLGELTLPKLKAEAGCRGKGKTISKSRNEKQKQKRETLALNMVIA